ncbi:MAG: hydroxymethylpyrimidine/phosphomethylpyrimidine kinase [Gammaproteobacteria bacterium]|nr:hydroxymethylpyrimidine/phosphomethylpyrimidine kinase [Gammaproteobacteria bacterium]
MNVSSDSPRSTAPVVLCIGGHDPSGAGLQADIETCAALDCLALSVVTALTQQNTARVLAIQPQAATALFAQIELLLEDFSVDACKLGLLPTVAQIEALSVLLNGPLAGCPLVIDPLLRAGSGGDLVQERIEAAFIERLLPRATVLTPNRAEALHYAGCTESGDALTALMSKGCQAILLTDARPGGDTIENILQVAGEPTRSYAMARFDGEYHGTGCTLATAIACGLARGERLEVAVERAQAFVHRAVAEAWRPGSAQHLPRRYRGLLP